MSSDTAAVFKCPENNKNHNLLSPAVNSLKRYTKYTYRKPFDKIPYNDTSINYLTEVQGNAPERLL